jgi:hypothetical protein
MSPRQSRQHTTGWAYAGSQRQIQAYVNNRDLAAQLDDELRAALPPLVGSALEWRAPLASDRYIEPRDAGFWPAIDRPDLADAARDWWPARGGPSWDAIALAHHAESTPTVVLVEAKANAPELSAGAFSGTSPKSKKMIETALNEARQSLGAGASLDAWMGPHYQLANRLAWTLWLREHSVDAVFAHVLFEGDLSHIPTPASELNAAVEAAHQALGIADRPLAPWAATVLLPATQ